MATANFNGWFPNLPFPDYFLSQKRKTKEHIIFLVGQSNLKNLKVSFVTCCTTLPGIMCALTTLCQCKELFDRSDIVSLHVALNVTDLRMSRREATCQYTCYLTQSVKQDGPAHKRLDTISMFLHNISGIFWYSMFVGRRLFYEHGAPKHAKRDCFCSQRAEKKTIRTNACRNNQKIVSRSMGSLAFPRISPHMLGATLCSHEFTIILSYTIYHTATCCCLGTHNTLYRSI